MKSEVQIYEAGPFIYASNAAAYTLLSLRQLPPMLY